MSDATPTTLKSPSRGDVAKLIAQLRDDKTAEVRAEVAGRLVVFAAHEDQPLAKGALLERAANLVCETDPSRELLLLRESFRQHPRYDIGVRLCQLAEDDESLMRLGRLGHLFDAVAALATPDERPWALLRAARAHVAQSHGRRAAVALDALGEPLPAMGEEPDELRKIAASQREDRLELMTSKRMEIAEATRQERGQTLLEYAQLLLAGDEPLSEVSAVLADAVEAGADRELAAPLWAEVARAVGDTEMLGRALAASLDCDQPIHERLRTADELANRSGIDDKQPDVARRALEVLSAALPDDLGVQARLLALRAITGDDAARHHLDQLRLHTVKERDREGEALVCLAMARVEIHNKNDAQAERYMRRVRTLDPRNSTALDYFEARFRATGDVKRLYMVLSHRLPGTSGDEAVRIACDMAKLAEQEMDSPERAIEAWHRVLGVAPAHPQASDALVRLYGASQRWAELRDVLERRAVQAEANNDATALADALATRAALHSTDGALAEPSAALELWRRVAQLSPDRAGVDDALNAALRAMGSWQELAERLALRLDDATHGETAARQLLTITLDAYESAPLAGRALEALVSARAIASDRDLVADDALIERAARRLKSDKHLLTVLRWRRARSEEGDAVELLEEGSALAAWALDDKSQAIELFEDLLGLRPKHPAALRGLSRLYEAVGRPDDQIAMLEKLLEDDMLDDRERAGLLEQLATAHADGRKDMSAADIIVKRLLSLQPSSAIGLRLAQRGAVARGDLDGLRSALGTGKDGANAYVEQVEALAAELEGVPAVAPLRAAAKVAATELKDAERAAELCGMALLHTTDSEDDSLATDVANELLAYAESAGADAWAEQALATLASRGPEPSSVQRLLADRAEQRDDWDEAREAWGRALEGDKDAAQLVSDAERLCDASERADEMEGVVAIIAAAIARHRATTPESCVTAVIAMANWAASEGVDLVEALGAVDATLDATTEEATTITLLVAREGVLVEQGHWADVVSTLERRAALLDGEAKVETMRRAAAICDGVASDAAAAARLYAAVLEATPGDSDAWSLRLAACERADDEPAMLAALDAFLAADAGDASARAAAAVQRIERTDGDDHESVLRVAASILPSLTGARPLLDDEELVFVVTTGRLEVKEHAHAAAALVLPVARAYERWEEVLQCVELLGANAKPGSPEHVASLLDQADLAHGHTDNGPVAMEKLAEAIKLAPADLDVWKRALAIADARADLSIDKLLDGHAGIRGEKPNLQLLRLVTERAAMGDDVDRAASAWTALRDLNPTDLEPHEALEAVHRERADLQQVAAVLEARLDAKPADDEPEITWLRLAMLHAEERAARADAIDVLTRGLQAYPESELLWASRIEIAEADPTDARKVLADRLNMLTPSDDTPVSAEVLAQQAQLHRDLAALQEEDAPNQACTHWLAVLAAAPDDDEAVGRAAAALLAQADPGLPAASHGSAKFLADHLEGGEQGDLLDAILQSWAAGSDEAEAVALHLRRAAADPSQAFERLAGALVTRPGNGALIEALASHEGNATPAARVEAWTDAADAAPEDQRAPLQLRAIRAQVSDDDSRDAGFEAWSALWRATPDAADFDDLIAALLGAGREVDAQALRLERLEDAPSGIDARNERASLAKAFADSGDRDSAQAQWQQLVFADPTDIEATAALRDLATTPEELIEVDSLLAMAAEELKDATARGALRRDLAERALERDAWLEATDLLDAALVDVPDDAEAFALRDLALGAMEPATAGERLSAHLKLGIERADAELDRRILRLRLADHEANYGGGATAALAVLRVALDEAPADERIDLLALTIAAGEEPGTGDADIDGVKILLKSASEDKNRDFAAAALRALATRTKDIEAAAELAIRAGKTSPSEDDAALLHQVWTSGARTHALVDALWPTLDDKIQRAEVLEHAIEHHGASSNDAWLLAWAAAAPGNLSPRAIRFAQAPEDEQRWKALQEGSPASEAVLEALLGSLDFAQTPAAQASLFVRAADLADASGDGETAAAYLGMALEHSDDAKLRERRRSLLDAAGAKEGLAEALEAEAASTADVDSQRKLLEQALQLWADELKEPARASAVFARIQALAPDDPALIVRGVALQRAAGDDSWREAAIATQAKPETTTTESRRLALAAYLDLERLEDAVKVARQAVEADGNSVLGEGLERLADDAEALPEVDARWVLETRIAAVDADSAPQVWASLRLRWLSQCEDPEDQLRALDELVQHAMGPLEDADLAMDWRVRALMTAPQDRERIMQAMAHADTPARLEAALPAALDALATAGKDKEADISAFAAVFDVDQPGTETAALLVERSHADVEFATEAASIFGDLLTERELHAHAIGLRRAALAGASGPNRVSGLIELANGVAGQGDLMGAMAALLDGCGDVEHPEELVERAKELADEAGDPKAFVETVERRLGQHLSTEPATDQLLVQTAAASAAADLEDASRAAELYNHLWERDPDNADARDAVLALRRDAGDATALMNDIDRALMQGGGGMLDLRVELAGLLISAEERTSEAMRQLKAVLRQEPAHEEAAAHLESIAAGGSHVTDALRTLELAYRAQKDWSGVTSVLRRRIEATGSDAKAARQLGALAEVLEKHLNAPDLAADIWARLVLVEATTLRVRTLLRLAPTAENSERLDEAWTAALASHLSDTDRGRVLEATIARAVERGDTASTEQLLRNLIALKPTHEDAWEQLDALLEDANRWSELIAALKQRIAGTKSDALRIGLQHRLAGMARASGQKQDAIDAYEALAKADPESPDPLEALAELHADGEPKTHCDALERWAERLPKDSTDRADVLLQAARLCAGKLGDDERAAAHYLRAFDLNPADDESFRFVERAAEGQPAKLQKLYRRRAEGVTPGPAHTVVLRKLGAICIELGKPAEARAALEKALTTDESNEVLQRELIAVCEDAGDVSGFQRAATHRLKFEIPRVERVMLVRKLARHAVEQNEEADRWLEELKELAPQDPELSALSGLVQARSEDPETAAAGLERMMEQVTEPDRQIEILWRLTGLYEDILDQPIQAINALRRLLRVAPGHWEANEKLCTLYAARGSQEALTESLRHWADATDESDSSRAAVLGQLGAAYLKLNRGADAVKVLEEAYALTKDDITINLPLAIVWTTLGRFEEAADLQTWVVDRLRRTRERAQLPAAAARAGMLCERVGRHKDAKKHYRTALKGAPTDVDATLGLGRVSALLGDDARAMVEFEKVAAMGPRHAKKSDKAQALLAIGRLHNKLGRANRARSAFTRALELQPDLAEASEELRNV